MVCTRGLFVGPRRRPPNDSLASHHTRRGSRVLWRTRNRERHPQRGVLHVSSIGLRVLLLLSWRLVNSSYDRVFWQQSRIFTKLFFDLKNFCCYLAITSKVKCERIQEEHIRWNFIFGVLAAPEISRSFQYLRTRHAVLTPAWEVFHSICVCMCVSPCLIPPGSSSTSTPYTRSESSTQCSSSSS